MLRGTLPPMLYSLHTPPDNQRGPQYMSQAWAAIHRLLPAGQRVRIGWARTAERSTILWCELPESVRQDVAGHWLAQYPDCQLRRLSRDPTMPEPREHSWFADVRLEPSAFPLRTFVQFEDRLNRQLADPLAAGLAAVAGIGSAQIQGGVELEIEHADHRFSKLAKRLFKQLDRSPLRHRDAAARRFTTWGLSASRFSRTLARLYLNVGRGSADSVSSEEPLAAAQQKMHSPALFAARMRLFVHGARSATEARAVIQRMTAALGPFALPHGAVFRLGRVRLQGCARRRTDRNNALFTADELATLWHPATSVVRAERFAVVQSRELEPPAELPTRRDHPDMAIIGRVKFRGRREVFGSLANDRQRHLMVMGKTGMGKSALLQNLIVSDIRADRGVILLDPHGDLAEAVLACIPTHRTNDVILFDAADQQYPIGFNLLDDRRPEQRALIASGIVTSFQKLWGDSWGPRLEYILRNSVLALLGQPGTTLVSVSRLLTDVAYRKLIVGRCDDPLVRNFWQNEFAHWKPQLQVEATGPVLNKVGAYLSSPLLRAIVGQPRNMLPLRRIMDEGRVLIVNLSKGRMGEDASALLGMLLVTGVQLAAMSRADIPEAERRDCHLYVDEFQNFATSSFATILSEARKFRLALTVSNQYLEQLDESLRAAVFGNIGSLLTFQVGGRDAEELSLQLGGDVTTADLMSLPKYTAYLRLLIDGMPSRPFSLETLPPPPPLRDSHRIDVLRRLSRQRYAQPLGRVANLIEQEFAAAERT
jgi:hypothetical protein